MKWTIPQLKKQKDFQFNEVVDLSEIKQQDDQIRSISPVQVSGYLVISGDTFTFPLRIKGVMTLPCSRTLQDVEFPFDIEAKEIFRLDYDDELFSSNNEEIDDEIHPIKGDVIDLKPYIKERILLEIPLQIFCESSNEEMLRSGKDWEYVTEVNKSNQIDPRLAKLSQLFAKNDGNEKH